MDNAWLLAGFLTVGCLIIGLAISDLISDWER